MDSTNNDKWPISKFYFLVTLKGGLVEGDISFQEVSGLDQETDIMENGHVDSPTFGTIKMPGMIKNTNVVCKKGIISADKGLLDMFNDIFKDKKYYATLAERMTITIKLLDEKGEPVMTWELTRAFPAKLQGTDLKSDSSEIAIEMMEFAHEGITVTM